MSDQKPSHDQKIKPAPHELDLLRKERDEYLNGWKRALADYDNYKKEVTGQIHDLKQYQLVEIAHEILPFMDAFEQALNHIPEHLKEKSWFKGLLQIKKQWEQFIKDHDIQVIESLGKQFDPQLHEAIDTEQQHDKKDHEITAELSRGYTLRDILIRPAKVTVNKLPGPSEEKSNT